jgi:hypothetical protein
MIFAESVENLPHPMSPRLRAFALLLTVAALAQPARSAAEPASETVSLDDSMKRIDEAYKGLRRFLRAPESAAQADALAFVGTLKAEATRSRELVPESVAALPEAEREAALKTYREQMDGLLKSIGELEAAIQASDWTQAAQVARTMQRQKSEGHERFKVE